MTPETGGTIYSIKEDKDTAKKLYLGFDINAYFSAELNLADLGAATLRPNGYINYKTTSLYGLFYFLNSGKKTNQGWTSYIKSGLGSISNTASVPFEKVNAIQLLMGLGVEHIWKNGIAARLDLESFDKDATALTLGVLYRFGKTQKNKNPAITKRVIDNPAPLDTDGDGIADNQDNCPKTEPNSKIDNFGCELDSDSDGVIDSQDFCPRTELNAKVNKVGCELDSDNDGVVNSQDFCPRTAPSVEVNSVGCEIDSDDDGVTNSQDNCPNSSPEALVDEAGCEFEMDSNIR